MQYLLSFLVFKPCPAFDPQQRLSPSHSFLSLPPGIGRVCDGVPEVRRAARDELRKGAHMIKVMASGGVASPTDKLESTQFSLEELIAAVDEAEAVGSYVCAHAYTSTAIARAVKCGVRSIEHGNLVDLVSKCKMFGTRCCRVLILWSSFADSWGP